MSNDRKHLKKIAPLGGKATLAKFGSSHFSKLAKDMWKKRKEQKVDSLFRRFLDNK